MQVVSTDPAAVRHGTSFFPASWAAEERAMVRELTCCQMHGVRRGSASVTHAAASGPMPARARRRAIKPGRRTAVAVDELGAVTGPDAQTVRSAWTAMEVNGWWVSVPLAVAALLTGLVVGHPLGPIPALLGADLARADDPVHRYTAGEITSADLRLPRGSRSDRQPTDRRNKLMQKRTIALLGAAALAGVLAVATLGNAFAQAQPGNGQVA
jgi:hypothetical protein